MWRHNGERQAFSFGCRFVFSRLAFNFFFYFIFIRSMSHILFVPILCVSLFICEYEHINIYMWLCDLVFIFRSSSKLSWFYCVCLWMVHIRRLQIINRIRYTKLIKIYQSLIKKFDLFILSPALFLSHSDGEME